MEPDDLPRIDVGDHVTDRDDPDSEVTMLVYGRIVDEASSVYLPSGETVAQANPEYPPDDRVIQVVYPATHWLSLNIDEEKVYSFPRSRLELVEPIHSRDDTDD